MSVRLGIDAFLPGGIKPTDHLHRETNDGTCSRCRRYCEDDPQPALLLWIGEGGDDLLIYCDRCCRPDVRRCRTCGCTDDAACWDDETGPCGWAEADLCTACASASPHDDDINIGGTD